MCLRAVSYTQAGGEGAGLMEDNKWCRAKGRCVVDRFEGYFIGRYQ